MGMELHARMSYLAHQIRRGGRPAKRAIPMDPKHLSPRLSIFGRTNRASAGTLVSAIPAEIDEQMEVRGLKHSAVARGISEKFGAEYPADRVADFLKGKHRPCSDEVAAWEGYFGVQLPPRYYGWGEVHKP